MKFSENWLRHHVPTNASRDELAATLTAIGLEVEDVAALGESLDGVIVARIVSAQKHPEADRLQVCEVDTGNGVVQIVCGAPQTIWTTPLPVSTSHTCRRSASGCFCALTMRATITPSSDSPSAATSSTSRPIAVSVAASSSRDAFVGTWWRNQFSENFMRIGSRGD